MVYAIVNNSDLTQDKFNELKSQGIEQTSLESCRRSLDGSKVLIKWPGETPPGLVTTLFQGNVTEARAELAKPEWQPAI